MAVFNMDDYRSIENEYDASLQAGHDLRRRAYGHHGNAVPALQLATVESEAEHLDVPVLPDDFDDFDAKEFIDRAYKMATLI